MCETFVEGSVNVTNKQLTEELKRHNELLKKQNEILLEILNTLKWRR